MFHLRPGSTARGFNDDNIDERKYLRPDTLYADERYANITQTEINEAKIRVAKRRAPAKEPEMPHHQYDHVHAKTKEEVPLYP